MHLSSISQPPSARVSPIARELCSPTRLIGGRQRVGRNFLSRSHNNSPLPGHLITDPSLHYNASSAYPGHGFPYYDDPGSPIMDTMRSGAVVHGPRARSARIPRDRYNTLDARGMDPLMGPDPRSDPYLMRDPRDRSLDRLDPMGQQRSHVVRAGRDRSLDRSMYLRDDHVAAAGMGGVTYRDPLMDDPYRDPTQPRSLSHSLPVGDPRHSYSRDSFVMELQARLNEIQNQYAHVKRELDATTQKLGSSMHSIKTFWSPELKKERALRKEEAAKYSLLSDQLKILRSENQVRRRIITRTFFFISYILLPACCHSHDRPERRSSHPPSLPFLLILLLMFITLFCPRLLLLISLTRCHFH